MRWLAATLMALLALTYALIALASPSTEVRPAPDDRGLGGLSGFTQALRSSGYRVALDPSTRPRLNPDDVVVAPVLSDKKIPESALRHVREGGRAFVIGIPDRLQPVEDSMSVKDVRGRLATVDDTEFAPANPFEPKSLVASVSNWSSDDYEMTSLQQVGKGRLARLDAGALATNRFLPRRDNARVVLDSLGTVAHRGDRLVFLAEGYGEGSSPGPIEAIGPGAVGALWQTLIILAAFGLVRGIRFGLPEPDRMEKRGSRELLDAVSAFYRRGRYTNAALAVAAKHHPEDGAIHALVAKPKVTEEEAKKALIEINARSGKLR